MSVPYKVVECSNPSGAAGVDYACNRRAKSGDYVFSDLAEDISNATSVTVSDVQGILAAYFFEISRHIGNGHKVTLEGIGTLSAAIRCRCFPQSAIRSADFSPTSYIRNARIRFMPDAALKKYVRQRIAVRRVSSDLLA